MNIREYIKKSPLVFDGAMGTYYADLKKIPLDKCEMANLNDAASILAIHQAYIEAGCGAIRTNTFAANELSLECDFELLTEVIRSGYEIALKATRGSDIFVFADIGPIPLQYESDFLADYKRIVDVFLDLGASHFLFETFSSSEYLGELSNYIKRRNPQAFIITSFAVSPEAYTRQGNSANKIMAELAQVESIDALGFNCFCGPYHLLQLAKNMEIRNKAISIMPNAGYPTVINNRVLFANNSDYYSSQMSAIAQQGVAILGGCCGTTPEYIRATVARVNGLAPDEKAIEDKNTARLGTISISSNQLLDKMQQGKKIMAVELDPPLDTDIGFFMESAKKLKEVQIDAITIADCPIARARVDSSLLACKLKRELDITPIPHLTCRDRNINASKALLLGLNIEGINNVLVVSGDPIPSAERNEVKSIANFNSVILANYIRSLNESTFTSPFNICGALNVNAKYFDAQLKHAQRKIDNGVSMFLTQPVLSREALENLKRARQLLPAKILGGIMPVVSYRNACFMNNEIAGIKVSEEICHMYKDVSKERADQLAINISTAIAQEIAPYVDGYYLITPFKRIDIITAILENIQAWDTCN